MNSRIEISGEAAERAGKILASIPGGAQKAMSAALNRGLSRIKTVASREVRKVYTASAAAISEATKVQTGKASAGNLVGYVNYSGKKIPLYKFQVSPKTPNSGQPVSALVKRGEGGSLYDAFIAEMKNEPPIKNHTGLFQRVGVKRFPIKEVMGLAMAQMVENNEIVKAAEAEAQQTVEKRIEHEIERILNGYGV